MKEKDELGEQEEELLCKISRLCEQLQEKENDIAKKEERITELKRKIDNNKHVELKNEEFYKEIEKLSKEKKELYKEIEKLSKEKHILYNKKEELYKRQKELYAELDELQCRFKEINQKNKNLSQELKKKFEELDEANDLIENQSFKLDGIRKDCNNEVKSLKNLLLKQDAQIEQLEGGLKEVVNFIQRAIQHIVCEVEKPIKRSRDNNIEAVLKKVSGEVQVIKSLLEELKETTVQHLPELVKDSEYASLPEETSIPLHAGNPGYESEEDSGYNSRSSTPTKPPDSLLTESYERNQSEGICKT